MNLADDARGRNRQAQGQHIVRRDAALADDEADSLGQRVHHTHQETGDLLAETQAHLPVRELALDA